MAKIDLLSREWCNIVFQGRNKSYGAYQLRSEYGRHLLWALLITLALLAAMLLVPLAIMKAGSYLDERERLKAIANLSKLEEAEAEKMKNMKAVATAVRAHMRLDKRAVKFRPSVDVDADDDINIGESLEADDNASLGASDETINVPADTLNNQYSNDTDPVVPQSMLTPLQTVEEMPQFPGGLGAMMRWLDRNVKYPDYCVKKKIEGEVRITFIVDRKGNITDAKVAEGVHPFLDREALLAVKRMPKWTPGRVGGRVSLVQVTIPVVFQLE